LDKLAEKSASLYYLTPEGEKNKFSSSPTELLRSKSEGKEENEVLFAFAVARKVDYVKIN
jgi:hypothetical protein